MKLDRKDFLKIAGGAIAGGAAGHVFSGAPFQAMQWVVEWTQDQHVPSKGDEQYIQSICQECPDSCTLSIRMIGQRAVKIETSDAGCPVGQNLLQMLYHSERIKQPLKRVGKKGSGDYAPVSLDDALKDITAKINKLRKANKSASLAAINAPQNPIANQLLGRLVTATGSPHVYTDSSLCNLNRSLVKLIYNTDATIDYDIENSDFILSFGSRVLEGWGPMAKAHKAFLNWKSNGAKLVHIDALCTRTASLADQWIPINPGTESILAMGIAYHLVKMGKSANAAEFARWTQMLFNHYHPDKVAKITGIPAATIKKLAEDFSKASKPIALGGRGGKGVSSSTQELAAILALNMLAGNIGKKGGVLFKSKSSLGTPPLDAQASASLKNTKRFQGLDDFIKNGKDFDILIINEANPVYKSAYGKQLVEKMKKASLVISFNPICNDTAAYADYILPSLSSLESASPAANDEAIKPRYKSMHTGDIILQIAKGIDGVAQSFPWKSYKDLLAAGRPAAKNPGSATFPYELYKDYLKNVTSEIDKSKAEYPLVMIPFEVPNIGDGDGMAFPYVLKSIDRTIFSFEKMVVHMHPDTADKEGISEGCNIDLVSKRGEIGSMRVHLTKTVAPGVVAIPLGFGHNSYTSYGSDKGYNPKEIMTDTIDSTSGTADWWFTRVKIS